MLCSECDRFFVAAPHNRERQVTCGRRACKLARIKRRLACGFARKPKPKNTMLRRARLRWAEAAAGA